jgi:hypothetical protein
VTADEPDDPPPLSRRLRERPRRDRAAGVGVRGFGGRKRVKGGERHVLVDRLGLPTAGRVEPAGASRRSMWRWLIGHGRCERNGDRNTKKGIRPAGRPGVRTPQILPGSPRGVVKGRTRSVHRTIC